MYSALKNLHNAWLTRYTNKQENVTQSRENLHVIRSTGGQILELSEKNFKITLIRVLFTIQGQRVTNKNYSLQNTRKNWISYQVKS